MLVETIRQVYTQTIVIKRLIIVKALIVYRVLPAPNDCAQQLGCQFVVDGSVNRGTLRRQGDVTVAVGRHLIGCVLRLSKTKLGVTARQVGINQRNIRIRIERSCVIIIVVGVLSSKFAGKAQIRKHTALKPNISIVRTAVTSVAIIKWLRPYSIESNRLIPYIIYYAKLTAKKGHGFRRDMPLKIQRNQLLNAIQQTGKAGALSRKITSGSAAVLVIEE